MEKSEMKPNVGQDYLLIEHMRKVKSEERNLLSKNSFVSIFSSVGEKKKKCNCLLDVIPCPECTDSALIKESKYVELECLLGILNAEQYYVISRRYELDGCEKKSFEAIADCLGITKKEVHQIHDDALFVLRQKDNAKVLKTCLC